MKKNLFIICCFLSAFMLQSLNAAPLFSYSQDFESSSGGYALPAGWTTTATPDYPEDKWLCGSLGSGSGVIWGQSGVRYAYILTNTSAAHNSWLFSAAMQFTAGKTYDISFYVRLHGAVDHSEALEVKVGTATTPAGMTASIYKSTDAFFAEWRKVEYRYTAATTGSYYVGFHSTSPLNASIYASFIDDFKVVEAPEDPTFEANTTMNFSDIPANLGISASAVYNIYNPGVADLNVSLKSNSPEVTVAGLPKTIPGGEWGSISVELALTQAGSYTGNFVLQTNDPNNNNVEVKVRATGITARVTDYFFEDFESGKNPEYWTSESGSFVVNNGNGIDGGSAYRANLWGSVVADFSTHYVNMGSAPKINFSYKAPGGTADAVALKVLVSKDFGKSFDTVYKVEPDSANKYVPSANYTVVDANLNSYANEKCMIKIIAASANGDNYWLYVDNMAIGTRPANDLAAVKVQGATMLHKDSTYSYTVSVRNLGTASVAAGDYKVRLMTTAGLAVDSAAGVAIAGGEVKNISLSFTPVEDGLQYIYGEILLSGDENTDNNKSAGLNVLVLSAENTNTIPVGNGSATTYYLPFNMQAGKNAAQSIYYPHEIGSNGGYISGIVYKTKFAVEHSNKPVQVWIGETSLTNLRDSFADPATFTKVFEGTLDFTTVDGAELPVSFNTPYEYRGGNLIVYTHNTNESATYDNSNYYVTNQENCFRSRIVYIYSPSSPTQINLEKPDLTEGATKFTQNFFPNIKFLHSISGMGELKGNVTNAGEPVAGAKVKIAGSSLYRLTDAEGNYSFYLTPGTYDIEAEFYGYETQNVSGVIITADGKTTEDINFSPLSTYTLRGVVTDGDAAIEGAKIMLEGYESYQTETDAAGAYELNDVFGGRGIVYELTVSFKGYTAQTHNITIMNDTVIDFSLYKMTLPVRNAKAAVNAAGTEVSVTWAVPGAIDRNYILDDSTAEGRLAPGSGSGGWLGNEFIVDEKGVLTSVDLYGVDDNYGSTRTVSIDIFDEDRNLVGSSEKFIIPINAWINVPLNDIPYSGVFYAMVHWELESGPTSLLGFDNNGPNPGYAYAYNMPGMTGWQSNPDGVFMLRANGVSYGSTISYAAGKNGAAASKSVNGYIVYRVIDEVWTELATVADTTYTDAAWAELPDGVYQYAIKAKYENDSISEPAFTNTLRKGVSSIAIEDKEIFIVYPNPVTNILNIETSALISEIVVINNSGKVVKVQKGDKKQIDLHALSAGYYVVRIRTAAGVNSFKIVKQ